MDDNKSKHLLLVDDDRLVLATIGSGLERAGYKVTRADSALEALRSARSTLPDLAIIDIRMPGMSGIELAQELQNIGKVPFLMLTAYGEEELVQDAGNSGALGYIIKPVDIPQLVPALETALYRAKELNGLKTSETKLIDALQTGRHTSMAIGVLMERFRMEEAEAFGLLRARARSQRRRIEEVARELLENLSELNWPNATDKP